tara:strand:- start:3143 stop:3364 length:222 start_codon:yes stop_codon:yes gene_type:complete
MSTSTQQKNTLEQNTKNMVSLQESIVRLINVVERLQKTVKNQQQEISELQKKFNKISKIPLIKKILNNKKINL